MQECSALLEFLLCNHAGFKIVQGSFCARFCVPRPSPRLCDACQFCFTIALEAALFAGAWAVLQPCRGELLWLGCNAEDSGGQGCSSSSCTVLSSGVGLFCSGFSVGTTTILCQAIRRSCQSYTLHILASRREKRWSCLCHLFVQFIVLLRQCQGFTQDFKFGEEVWKETARGSAKNLRPRPLPVTNPLYCLLLVPISDVLLEMCIDRQLHIT